MIPPELLPDHPEPGQVVELPDGEPAGQAAQITISSESGTVLGYAENIEHVANIAGHYILSNVTLSGPILAGSLVHVVAYVWDITAIEFVNFFGWHACRWGNPDETLTEKFKIIETVPAPIVIHQNTTVKRYVALCLKKGDADHDTPRT